MDIDTLQEIAGSFPAAESEIKWKSDLVFMVARKMFCQIDLESPTLATCFKVPEEDFETLCSRPGFRKAPYFGRYGWVMVEDVSSLKPKEWRAFLGVSYGLVRKKLPRKIREGLEDG